MRCLILLLFVLLFGNSCGWAREDILCPSAADKTVAFVIFSRDVFSSLGRMKKQQLKKPITLFPTEMSTWRPAALGRGWRVFCWAAGRLPVQQRRGSANPLPKPRLRAHRSPIAKGRSRCETNRREVTAWLSAALWLLSAAGSGSWSNLVFTIIPGKRFPLRPGPLRALTHTHDVILKINDESAARGQGDSCSRIDPGAA